MLVLKSEIKKRKCGGGRTCEKPGTHCALREPLETIDALGARERIERMVHEISTEFFMPLDEVTRILRYPSGSSMTVILNLRLHGILGEEESTLAVLVTGLNGKNGESTAGDLEAIYHVRPVPPYWEEHVERIPLSHMNIETIIKAILEHPFMFRI